MGDSDATTLRRPDARTSRRDSSECAHIVMKHDQMRGYVAGEPIQALCGKVWVPSRDYEGLPLCQACADERERLLAGMNRRN
jgi:hypothetical protein